MSLRSVIFLIGLFKIDPPQSAGGGLNIQLFEISQISFFAQKAKK
jgi:hypothetical protein